MSQPLLSLNLRPDFYSVAEGEHNPAVQIDSCIIHKPTEQLLVEIHRQLPRLAKPRKKASENVILDFLPLPPFLQVLQSSVPTGIPTILFAVVVLVRFPCGTLIDQLLNQLCGHLLLAADRFHLRVNGTAVCQDFHDFHPLERVHGAQTKKDAWFTICSSIRLYAVILILNYFFIIPTA